MRSKKVATSSSGSVRLTASRGISPVFSFFGVVLLATCLCACGQSSPASGSGASGQDGTPQLTDEVIRERINDTRVWDVPPEEGNGEQIVWNFDEDEPKEITVVERKDEGDHAIIVLDIKTQSAPRRRNARALSGQVRTHWQLRTGWVLRRWEITDTENISMKYRNIENQPGTNSNNTPPPIPAR